MDADLVAVCLKELAASEDVVAETVPNHTNDGAGIPAAYLVPFHRAESSLAGRIVRLINSGADRMSACRDVDWDKALAWLRKRTGVDLAPEQEQAV